MPVADVRAVFVADSPSVRDSLISAHMDHLETELVKTQAAVNSLRALLDSPGRTHDRCIGGPNPVSQRWLSPKTAWTRRMSKPGGVRL